MEPVTPDNQAVKIQQDAMSAAREQLDRDLTELRRKRMQELANEEQELEAKRRKRQQDFEEACAREEQEFRRRRALEAEQHARRLEEMEAEQRAALKQEREQHEETLALLIEQQSSIQASLEARQAQQAERDQVARAAQTAQPAHPGATSLGLDDMKAKLREKTILCKQLSNQNLTTPPASAKAPSPASAPRPDAPDLPAGSNSQGPATMEAPARITTCVSFNSSTHPAAWGALYRMTKQPDCLEEIKKSWDAGDFHFDIMVATGCIGFIGLLNCSICKRFIGHIGFLGYIGFIGL